MLQRIITKYPILKLVLLFGGVILLLGFMIVGMRSTTNYMSHQNYCADTCPKAGRTDYGQGLHSVVTVVERKCCLHKCMQEIEGWTPESCR